MPAACRRCASAPAVVQGLYTEMKFEKPSKIQAISLPMILTPPYRSLVAQARVLLPATSSSHRPVMCTAAHTGCLQAHNGSGKTTCFVLAMLSRVDPALREAQVCFALQALESSSEGSLCRCCSSGCK